MQSQSPPRHRHDGTSPLPMGLDWSPHLEGRKTLWPHDPRTGWSYCVTVPSWVGLAKSRDSDPVVLKRAFRRKKIPPAPLKGLLRMKTKSTLEEKRSSLGEWMAKLLLDVEVSRSISIASFLELEAAIRLSFQDEGSQSSELNIPGNNTLPSLRTHPSPRSAVVEGGGSLASDYGSDIADTTSENRTPSLARNSSEIETDDLSTDDYLTSPIDKFVSYGMSNMDEGLSMGQAVIEQLDGLPKHKLHVREVCNAIDNGISTGNASKASHFTEVSELLSLAEHGPNVLHARRLSSESFGSDMVSQEGSELLKSLFPNPNGDRSVDLSSRAEISKSITTPEITDFELLNDGRLIFPLDQRQILRSVLAKMQRKLVAAKTDMEDLISRLNQEISVKDYLHMKVKDLEVALEITKEKSKEKLEQAILVERERLTQMQWDLEELRRRSMKMELMLNSQQGQRQDPEVTQAIFNEEKHMLQKELDAKNQELAGFLKRNQELEVKAKADIKILVKEVKSPRSFQRELKQQLSQALQEKCDAEDLLQQEKLANEQARTCWRELVHRCKTLHNQFHECKVNLMNKTEDNLVMDTGLLPDALDLLTASENKISILISDVQHLALDVDSSGSNISRISHVDDSIQSIWEELRTMLADILINSALMRKQVNSAFRYALEMSNLLKEDDAESPSNVSAAK